MKVLITSALPYANSSLHFGHIAGCFLPADCYARFQKLQGNEVLFISGSDEYGLPITISAEQAGRTPQEHADIYHAINKGILQTFQISFDHFGRTTCKGHAELTQQFFQDLLNNGYIEERITDQLYAEKDNRFLADRYVVGTCPKCGFEEARGDECPKCAASYEAIELKHPRSKLTREPLIRKPTKHWFLRFDLFKEKLTKWLSQKDWKPSVKNFSQSYIDELKARAITRDSTWGVPIPLEGTEGKVFYVWFDAPIGYLSISMEWDPKRWKDFWLDEKTHFVEFMGKDNIPFHSIFFPAMIMGQNQPYKQVDDLPANEFLNLEGRKFSKSEGWTIDMETFFTKFTADQIRYYLAANAPETADAEFTWKEFQLRCNTELLGKFGNLANRALVFAQKHCEGKMPPIHCLEEDTVFLEKIRALAEKIATAYNSFHLRKAASLIMELCSLGNVYFDAKKPWQLAKDPNAKAAMQTTIGACILCLKTLAIVASPIIPEAAQKLWQLLGYDSELAKQNWRTLMDETIKTEISLPTPEPLFQKVEDEVVEKELEALQENLPQEKEYAPLKEQITIDDFFKTDLRVGEILSVEKVEKSKKLLKLELDLGFEKRTIVSGISTFFSDPQILVGKRVIIVANLKPAKLMGIESQGMLLCANEGDGIEIPYFTEANPGDAIS